jgi:hypothetical protein
MNQQLPKIEILGTDRQEQAFNAIVKPEIRRVLYGGAKGGGKSWFLCVWAFKLACDIGRQFGLKSSANPLHIGWIGRKQATDFAATTLQTWRQTIPQQYWQLKSGTEKDPKHILICDRVAIDYGGLDKQENINKFNSAEYAFFAIDQAEETTKEDVAVIQGSLRMRINNTALEYKELYTANPAQCWLKDEFINNNKPDNVFIPALPADNPYLPADYTKTLTDAFGYRPELLQAYLHGNWSMLESNSQIILDSWLQAAQGFQTLLAGKIIACDPARFGDDKTIILVLDGTEIIERQEMGYCRTTEISNKLAEMSRIHGNIPIVVDEIGIGAGVCDELYSYGRRVIPFNAAEKAENEKKFYNRRAEAWWELAESLSHKECGCMYLQKYPELKRQLVIPTYDFRNGKIIVEAKDDIKARLGRSPDDADCYVMGVWGIKRNRPKVSYVADKYAEDYRREKAKKSVLTRGLVIH